MPVLTIAQVQVPSGAPVAEFDYNEVRVHYITLSVVLTLL